MDWVLFFGIGFVIIFLAIYAKKKIDSISYDDEDVGKVKIVALLTSPIYHIPNKNKKWVVSCYLFSDGRIEYQGHWAEEWFTTKSEPFQKFILPLSKKAKINEVLAKQHGIEFY